MSGPQEERVGKTLWRNSLEISSSARRSAEEALQAALWAELQALVCFVEAQQRRPKSSLGVMILRLSRGYQSQKMDSVVSLQPTT